MAYMAIIRRRLSNTAAVFLPLLEIQRAAVVITIQVATPPTPEHADVSSGICNG
jgi:hypothetical protein